MLEGAAGEAEGVEQYEMTRNKKQQYSSIAVQSRSGSDASQESMLSPPREIPYGSLEESSFAVGLEELPQGRHLGVFSTVVLFVSRIIGSGIWATPAAVYRGVGGSPALFLILWLAAALCAFAGLGCYLELGSLAPRSGGTKVFLELIYTRPKLMVSVVYSLFTLLFSICLTNSIIFGKYTLFSLGFDENYIENEKTSNYIGLLLVLVTGIIHGVSTKHGVIVQNFLGVLKLFLVVIMTFTGVYVIAFPQSITGLENHLHTTDFFSFYDDSLVSLSTVSGALLQCFFSFGGWASVHTVASEIKDPVRTLKIAGPLSLFIALINYTLINIAYLKVIPPEQFIETGPLIGSVLFEKVFGYRFGRQFVTISIALGAASNVFVVMYSISRMNQEIFREGYLPFSSIMASNFKHTNTPLYSLLLCVFLTAAWLLILPANGSSYNYIVSLEGYSSQLFLLLTVVGVFIIRKRYPLERAPIRSSLLGNTFVILISVALLIGPFINSSSNDATNVPYLPPYYITALIILGLCVLYWFIKFEVLPRMCKYELRKETLILKDGLTVKKWVRYDI